MFVFIIIVFIAPILGSFLNVCIYRIPRGESIVFPPSHCPNCKNRIKPYDLIPVLSFIILKGKCRYCNSRISIRYPIVELLSAICGLLSFLKYNISIQFFVVYLIGLILIYISFVDIDTFEISNISILILNILNIIFYISQNGFNVFYRIFVNGIISALIIFLIFFISKEKAMGFGDVLLSFSLGLNFNIPKAILFNFLAFVIGGLISIIIVLLINKKKLKSQIPFGPMISIAAYLTFLYGDAIINWYLGLIAY